MLLVSVGGLCIHMISRNEIHYFSLISQWSLVDSSFGMLGLLWVTWLKTCSMTCSSTVVFIFKLLSYLKLKLSDC